jgi:tripartite-type tricarboxylate transporter receptor subunit TctC
MNLPRRKFLHLTAGAALLATSGIARAQTYPTRPITMIVPQAVGGALDIVGRIFAERMRGSLGQPIIIENVAGGDGNIGTGRAARARPDGYTIISGSGSTHALNGALYSLPYDVLNDFAPISLLVRGPYALFAKRTMPANDLCELIAWLKANPNKASAGTTVGGTHVLTAFFQRETATQFSLVPYRSLPVQDLVAGQIDLYMATLTLLPLMRAGSIKLFAVSAEARAAVAPDIPTFAEAGLPALSYSGWNGLFAPKGTPKDIIAKLNAAAMEALADPTVRSRLGDFGGEIVPREEQTPEGLGAAAKADAKKWWPIIKELGIKAE